MDRGFIDNLLTRHALTVQRAGLGDLRCADTRSHMERICGYALVLAEALRDGYDEIDDDWVEAVCLASLLHDIGKVGVPDRVLLKPGRLTASERWEMQRHPLIGAETIGEIRGRRGEDAILDMAFEVVLSHHERWDGTGYPHGLSGDEIPLAARVVAVVDVYDALRSERVYKAGMSHGKAMALIGELSGAHFDPAIVAAFSGLAFEQFGDAEEQAQRDEREPEEHEEGTECSEDHARAGDVVPCGVHAARAHEPEVVAAHEHGGDACEEPAGGEAEDPQDKDRDTPVGGKRRAG